MCRNIKTLFNFDPPATHAEIHASALQFVRKLSGFNSPSQANAEAFNRAVSEVADSATALAGLAADQRLAARPRGRGREGEGALAGAVRLGRWTKRPTHAAGLAAPSVSGRSRQTGQPAFRNAP